MSGIQDSAAIIAADMRQLADDIEAGRAIVGQSVWRSYAGRVEAIGTGNIAKLRRVCEQMLELLKAPPGFNGGGMSVELDEEQVVMWRDRFLVALAAPARNCNTETNAKTPETITVKPLSLDDAISHADEVAGDCSTSCQQAHKQLADWLRELRNRRNGSGNSAALREACAKAAESAAEIMERVRHKDRLAFNTANYIEGVARTALAEPPRNCDIYLTEEAVDAATVTVRDCEACSRIDMEAPCVFCMVRWLLAPATEKEGGANG